MAIYISPRGLSVAELNNKIQHISLETWLCDIDGDLTYNSPQWLNEAWFHPRVERNKLIYGSRASRCFGGIIPFVSSAV